MVKSQHVLVFDSHCTRFNFYMPFSWSTCSCTCTCTYLFQKFWYMLPMVVTRASSGIVAIHYVFPVFWMTCFFYNGPYSGMNFAIRNDFA